MKIVCVVTAGLTLMTDYYGAHWLLNAQQVCSLTQPQSPIRLTQARWGCFNQSSTTPNPCLLPPPLTTTNPHAIKQNTWAHTTYSDQGYHTQLKLGIIYFTIPRINLKKPHCPHTCPVWPLSHLPPPSWRPEAWAAALTGRVLQGCLDGLTTAGKLWHLFIQSN